MLPRLKVIDAKPHIVIRSQPVYSEACHRCGHVVVATTPGSLTRALADHHIHHYEQARGDAPRA
jgi:hypothetical protein